MRGFFFEPLLKEPKQLKESWFLWKSEFTKHEMKISIVFSDFVFYEK